MDKRIVGTLAEKLESYTRKIELYGDVMFKDYKFFCRELPHQDFVAEKRVAFGPSIKYERVRKFCAWLTVNNSDKKKTV